MGAMNLYLVVIVVSLVAAFGLNTLAGVLGALSLDPVVPGPFRDLVSRARYAQSQRYALERTRTDILQDGVNTALILTAMGFGFFPWLDGLARSPGFGPVLTGLIFFALLGLAADLAALPFSVYRTFRLEARYGFNTTTPAVFATDKLKGWLVACLLGGPLAAALIAFFERAGDLAWVWCWLAVSLFMVFTATLAPVLILPLFNRFTPLEPGELRDAIEDLARRAGFRLSGIFVMDGSKRSTKANAFFTGLGRTKRIALYDTLVESQTTQEIVAVLAHEIGHSRLGHIRKRLGVGVLRTGFTLWLLSLFLSVPELFAAFGMERMSVHAGLVFFGMLYAPVSLATSVVSGFVSRRHEFAADEYAARLTGRPEELASALRKLSVKNLSNLTPHPLEVWLHYSHPPVLKRLERLGSVPH